MKIKWLITGSLICLGFIFQGPVLAVEVTLKDGTVLYGQIIENKKGTKNVEIWVHSEKRKIPKNKIESMKAETSNSPSSGLNAQKEGTKKTVGPIGELTPAEGRRIHEEDLRRQREQEEKEAKESSKEKD